MTAPLHGQEAHVTVAATHRVDDRGRGLWASSAGYLLADDPAVVSWEPAPQPAEDTDGAAETGLTAVLADIRAERHRQDIKFGADREQPDGTGLPSDKARGDEARADCQRAFRLGEGTWRHILDEEIGEAYAETDPALLAAELLQVASVAVAWIEDLKRRQQPAPPPTPRPGDWPVGAVMRDGWKFLWERTVDGWHYSSQTVPFDSPLLPWTRFEAVGEGDDCPDEPHDHTDDGDILVAHDPDYWTASAPRPEDWPVGDYLMRDGRGHIWVRTVLLWRGAEGYVAFDVPPLPWTRYEPTQETTT